MLLSAVYDALHVVHDRDLVLGQYCDIHTDDLNWTRKVLEIYYVDVNDVSLLCNDHHQHYDRYDHVHDFWTFHVALYHVRVLHGLDPICNDYQM